MSKLKQRTSEPDLRVRIDDSRKIRRPTRSASLKTEMAKIAYRNQIQKKHTIENSTVDLAALGSQHPIHRLGTDPRWWD